MIDLYSVSCTYMVKIKLSHFFCVPNWIRNKDLLPISANPGYPEWVFSYSKQNQKVSSVSLSMCDRVAFF